MKKSFTQKFLTISLNYQISLAILLILILYILLITGFIACTIRIFKNTILKNNKFYFYSIFQEIFESTILFYNSCLIQYEELVKYFDEQTVLYLSSLTLLYDNIANVKYDNIVKNFLNEKKFENYINYSTAENTIYLYCENDMMYQKLSNVIEINSISSLNILYSINNFRIPYYGNINILNNYFFALPRNKSYFSINITRIKEAYDLSNNNINDYLQKKSNINYNIYKYIFEIYRESKLSMYDIIFSSKIYIFDNYIKLFEKGENELTIENYLKNQSYYFQNFNYGTGEVFMNDNDYLELSKCISVNTIINNYIDYFFFELMTKHDDVINVPVYSNNNTIYSKNLCYALLLKQIRKLNNTMDINNIFNEEKLEEIYNSLIKGSSTIEDCILDKYYTHKKLNKIGNLLKNNFYKLYELENNNRQTLFKLIENDEDSYYYLMEHSHPSYTALNLFDPRYFPLNQINIYSFISATPAIRSYNRNKYMLDSFEYLVFLTLMFLWVSLVFIIIFIMYKVKYLVIKPILELKDILNSKEINDESNFGYKYDDDINEFFNSCKLLLSSNKEGNSNDFKSSETFINTMINNQKNKDDNLNNKNNNMILNLKMINSLIDSQKKQESTNGTIIEWNWKKIYSQQKYNQQNNLIEENNYPRKKSLRKKRNAKPNNIINLIKASSKSNELELGEDEKDFNFEESEEGENDLIYYKELLLITEFLYNNAFYNEKWSKYKMLKNNNILIKIKNFLSMHNNKNKNSAYIWYSKMKENNKTDFIKYYFNKSFEEIFISDEIINNKKFSNKTNSLNNSINNSIHNSIKNVHKLQGQL